MNSLPDVHFQVPSLSWSVSPIQTPLSPCKPRIWQIWWLICAISCFRVFAPKGEKRRHKNLSFCCYFDLRLSSRSYEGTTNKRRIHKRFLPTDTKFSTKKFSCLRLLKYLNFDFAPKIEIMTKIHVFVSSPFTFRAKTRKHEMA